MSNWFNRSLPIRRVKHSTFDLSHNFKSSFKLGYNVPNLSLDVLPSDKISLNSDIFIKLNPMKFPILHRVSVVQNYFEVPLRLILGNDLYEKFFSCTTPCLPEVRFGITAPADYSIFQGSVLDYLGYDININSEGNYFVDDLGVKYLPIGNGLRWLAYELCWFTYYADEQLDSDAAASFKTVLEYYREAVADNIEAGYLQIPSIRVPDDELQLYLGLHPVNYKRDYFTSAAVEPQRGADIYFGSSASPNLSEVSLLSHFGSLRSVPADTNFGLIRSDEDFDSFYGKVIAQDSNGNVAGSLIKIVDNDGNEEIGESGDVNLLDIFSSSQTSIRDLWKLEQVQRWLEIDNTYGTRIVEKLAGHFGVISSDKRLNIPYWLGGTSTLLNVSEVLQTSGTTEDSALGMYAGRGTAFGKSRGFRKHFIEEHGFIIGMLSVVPETGYCSGNERVDFKDNILDFAFPEFNNIGYQPIFNGELFLTPNTDSEGQEIDVDNKGTWAYQPRYSEYRGHRNLAVGGFRSDPTLQSWHLNRIFAELPPFNDEFIRVQGENVNRIFSVIDDSYDNAVMSVDHHILASRPISYMPKGMHPDD